jgi:hypothetical protein
MKTILFAAAALGAVAISGCAAVQNIVGSSHSSQLAAVARKIDAGAQLAAADLPSACAIVAQIAALAGAYSASGLARGGSATTILKTANGAAALAAAPLCQSPQTADPLAATIQIIGATAAVKAATAGGVSAPGAAASLPGGS